MTMRVRHLRAAVLSWLLTAAWAGAQTLAVVPTPGWSTSGGTLSVDIQLNSQGTEQPAALEWTLGFPVLELQTATAGPAAMAAGKPLQCSGRRVLARCALVGMNTNSIPDGVIATIRLRAASVSAALAPVMLTNIGAASPAADALSFQGEGAAITLVAVPGPTGDLLKIGTMAHIVAGDMWKTTVTLVNTRSSSSAAQLDFFDNAGQPLPLPLRYPIYPVVTTPLRAAMLSQTVEAGSVVVLETSTTDLPEPVEGWARLLSAGSIQGFVIFTHTETHQEAAVPLQSLSDWPKSLAFDNTAGKQTGVALANLTGAPVGVSAVIRSDQSQLLGTPPVIDLVAGGHTSFMLENAYGATAGLRGTVEFKAAGAAISAIGLRANGNAITTLPLLNPDPGNLPNSIAHVAAGAGWTTSLTLVNLSPASSSAALNFYTQQGNPLPLTLVYPHTGASLSGVSSTADVLPSGATVDLKTQPTPSPPDGSQAPPAVGSATLTGGVSGFAIFRFDATGQEAVVPLETRGASSYWLAYDNTDGLATGFAIANATGVGGYARLTFRDESGASLGTSDFILAPSGQASFVMADRFGITAGRRGTIEAAPPPGGRISMIGLRATPDGKFTTLPVMETGN